MKTTLDPLETLRVSDAMSKNIVEVCTHHSMEEVAARMVENEVSGVVVVNDQGRCVGVLSTSDFVKRDFRRFQADKESFDPEEHELAPTGAGGTLEISGTASDRAEMYMSPAVQSIDPDSPLFAAAKMMVLEHVHRLPVLDEGGHPVGLLTSTDLLTVLVNAHEELLRERRKP